MALDAAYAHNDARKRTNARTALTRKVQKIKLLTRLRVTLSHDSQPAWRLTRRLWQRVVMLALKHMVDIFLLWVEIVT